MLSKIFGFNGDPSDKNNMAYLDNNSTTLMPPNVIATMNKWTNKGNPSSSHKSAQACRTLMMTLRRNIGFICGAKICCAEPRDDVSEQSNQSVPNIYKVCFTASGSEANTMLLRSIAISICLDQFIRGQNPIEVPHIISTCIEHKNILLTLEQLQIEKLITYSLLPISKSGHINVSDLGAALSQYPNTKLVAIMHVNNETGAIQPIAECFSYVAKWEQKTGKRIIKFTDCVQSFGKININVHTMNIDCLSLSFHKIYGPPGGGALLFKQDIRPLMRALIPGSQNEGMRGGTENIIGLGAANEALVWSHNMRPKMEPVLNIMRHKFVTDLAAHIRIVPYTLYNDKIDNCIVVFRNNDLDTTTPNESHALCENNYIYTTILLSIVCKTKKLCNVSIKNILEENNIIVSIGSACNTASDRASHVLDALGASNVLKRGTLRISMGFMTDPNDMSKCAKILINIAKKSFS